MARYRQRIGGIPDGSRPKQGISVAVRRIADGVTLTTLLTDEDGFFTYQANGHPEAFFFHISNIPGGDKFWRSDDVYGAGAYALAELPVGLRVLGDGVIRDYASDLAVSLVSSGPSLSIAPGAANVIGHPFVVYSTVGLSNTRPSSGTRIDRVILRLYPTGSGTTPGKAEIALLAGTVDGDAPALTQSSTVYEFSLAQVNVPSAGSVVITDERVYSGEKPPISGEVRVSSASTDDGSGEALSGTSLDLVLPRTATYDVYVTLSALQVAVSDAEWTLLGTFTGVDSGLAFDIPGQVALDSSGTVYVADTANNRLIKLDGTGAYVGTISSLSGVTGVAVDSGGNIYVVQPRTSGSGLQLSKYDSALAFQGFSFLGTGSVSAHIATDSTHVYAAHPTDNVISKRLCSTLATVTSWGSFGSGNGQFKAPYGIAVGGGEVYVVDASNSRVQVFTTSGVYQRQWAIPSSSRGIAIDASGDVWVAVYGSDELRQYSNAGTLLTTISQANADGIGIASGDVLWIANADGDSLAKWDETGGGYGEVAIDIGGSVSTYEGPGNRVSAVGNAATGTATGPDTLTIQAYGKATSGTLSLQGLVLAARAVPRA